MLLPTEEVQWGYKLMDLVVRFMQIEAEARPFKVCGGQEELVNGGRITQHGVLASLHRPDLHLVLVVLSHPESLDQSQGLAGSR